VRLSPELDATLDMITSEGRGVVLYMRRGHERRGLLHTPPTCGLQNDNVGNHDLGMVSDTGDYGIDAQILAIWVSPRCCQQNAPLLSTTSGLAV
jgi:GTP cyclohydrolase II